MTMTLIAEWILPIDTISEANTHDHWRKKDSRRKVQCSHIDLAFQQSKPTIPLPCVVRMTRIAPRALDDDNIRSAFKGIRDRISFYLTGKDRGRGDSDPGITWIYAQEKGHVLTALSKKVRGVKIEFLKPINYLDDLLEII